MGLLEASDDVDLSSLPLAFLEAYPFPAFVLVVPVASRVRPRLLSRDTDVTVTYLDDVSPLSGPSRQPFPSNPVAWGNERWYRLTQGRTIGDCLDMTMQNRLQAWVEGEDPGEDQNGSFKLQLVWPAGVTLYLAKTSQPLFPPSTTHAFCVITAQQSSTRGVRSNTTSPTERVPPSVRSSFSLTSPQSTDDQYFANYRGSTDPLILSPPVSDRLPDRRPSSTSSLKAPEPTERPIDPPRSLSSYSNSSSTQSHTLAAREDRAKTRHRRRSPHAQPIPLIVESQTAPWWELVNSIDWSKTCLGDRKYWKDTLDPLLSVTFESRSADCCWLGPDLLMIYNQAYSELLDHPKSFGMPGREVWKNVWGHVGPLAEQCLAGTPVYQENDPVFFKRYGNNVLLEHYFTWRYVPITGKDGKILGMFNQCIDATDKFISDRRLATTREMSEQLLSIRSTAEWFTTVVDVLEQNPSEAPFVMCYRVQQTESTPASTSVDVTLETSVGVPEGHSNTQEKFSFSLPNKNRNKFGLNADRMSSPTLSAISALSSSSGNGRMCHVISDGTQWPILKALKTRQCVIVDDCSELIKGISIRQWDELPFAAIVIPICSEGSIDIPDAVMIMGLNVRRPFDTEYDDWVNAIRSQLVAALASAKVAECEQKLAEDNARMEKAKAAWFKGAAHDLRSPLSLVAGPISDLLASDVTAAQRQSLSIAQRNVERLLRLVNALMDFSRLEAGRLEGRFVPIDVGEYITDLATLFRPAVERLGITYTVDIQPSDQLIYVDPTLLETVISNLIGNALKYTERGSITVQLRFTDHAEISVIDTGVGIPQVEIPLVTEWYHRATTAIHAGTQGSGLGLALAKELLRLHDGELLVTSAVASELGQAHGSTFTARIPLSFQPAPPAIPTTPGTFGNYGQAVANEALRWQREEGESNSEGGGSAGESSGGSAGTRFSDGFLFDKSDTILLVEDNIDMRDYIKHIFTPYCTVTVASDGQQALQMAIKNPPNLILSDMMMPKMNGLELLTEIRNHPSTKIVPMVLLSAAADDESRVEALLMGAEDYLAKPFKPRELIARVHLHLQVGKKRQSLEKLYAARETELAVLSDYCPSGIMRADPGTGKITYANRAWREQGDLVDGDPNSWPDLVDDETRQRLYTSWATFFSGPEKEYRTQWKYNSGKAMTGVFIKLEKVHPEMSGILGCTTDITHEERQLVEAEERRKEAEESKHQQELLIDLTSHEIRTPVSAILQCSSLVKENLESLKDQLRGCGTAGFVPTAELLTDLEEDVEALESIYQCGLVQERIAGDVLSLARIQLDMLSLYDIEVDLRKEARKVSSVFASEAKMKKIDLSLVFGKSLEMSKIMSIKTDPVRLGQVVTNLISNAIRFTSASDVRKITVKYDVSFIPPVEESCALPTSIGIPSVVPAKEDTDIWLFVSVTDTGPGMSPTELAVLFKRFAQGNKMIHTKFGGSGLGLFICRKITELLGGRIEVLSQLGEGTVFRFFIKTRTVAPPSALAAYVEAASLGDVHSSGISSIRSMSTSPSIFSASSSTSPSPAPSPSLEGAIQAAGTEHILIVEDNIINQTVLKRQIVKAGLTCDVANNGLEALNLIRESHRQAKRGSNRRKVYDVVLMDLEMPVMDGLTAVKELRDSENSGSLPRNMVIALTGNARQGQIDQAMAAGMDDVVIKPYVLKNLLKKIRALKTKRADLDQAAEEAV